MQDVKSVQPFPADIGNGARPLGSSLPMEMPGPSPASAVSWGAVVAGAFAAASLSLILLMLGVGLGLSSVSPWAPDGISAVTFGVSTVVWLTFTQLVASATGGYMAGRLRSRWTAVHGDEVHFRDTAHGFLAWSLASLATAALLTSVIGGIVGGAAKAGASLVGAGASAAGAVAAASGGAAAARADEGGPSGYFIDSLFRRGVSATSDASASATGAANTTSAGSTPAATPDAAGAPAPMGGANSANGPAASNTANTANTAEVGRIFAMNLQHATLPPEDARYVAQLVSQRTGLAQADAEKRVAETYAKAQSSLQQTKTSAMEAADKARKATAGASLWLFVSLLIGAFVASLSATYGGRQRDL